MHVAKHCIPVLMATQPLLALPPTSSLHRSRSKAHGSKVLVQVSKPCPTQHGASVPQLWSWAGGIPRSCAQRQLSLSGGLRQFLQKQGQVGHMEQQY